MSFPVRHVLGAAALLVALGGSAVLAQNNPAHNPAAGQPLFTYTGDGLTLVVLTYSEDQGTLSGQIRQGAAVYPFTAKTDDDTGEIKGTFIVNGNSFPFTSRENEDGSATFATGTKTYKLKPVIPEAPKPPVAPDAPPLNPVDSNNPLNPVNPPVNPPVAPPVQSDANNPLNAPVNAPVTPPVTPLPPPANDNPLNIGTNTATVGRGEAAPVPEVIKLKRVEFRDVNMGGVVAYTMIVPHNWNADGRIEWSVSDTPYPQPHVQVTSPEGGHLSLMPMMMFMYTEAKPVPGFAPLPPSGNPAPRDIGQWYQSEILPKLKPDARNIRLVSDKRDPVAEESLRKLSREMGANTQNNDNRIHTLIYAYNKAGVAYREEVLLTYVLMPNYENQNIRSQMWTVNVTFTLAAPEREFDKLRPGFVAAFNTYLPTPKWFTQSQLLLMELAQKRIQNFANAMREAAARYEQINQQQMATFNQKMARGDRDQNTRVNSIYEVDDYRDLDGSLVKLPFHYKHTYSDGKGNIVQTNSTLHKPGSDFTEIEPHQFK